MVASRKPLRSNPVVDALAASLGRHVAGGARLTLAYSGGLDSTALLHALATLREAHPFELDAVHVHHGLSPNAETWVEFCARRCDAIGVSFTAERVEIARDDPAGIEAAARVARHRVFAGIAADFVVTAHQQDDQAETLLLQLLRGAGPKGLAAMPEIQSHATWHARQLRPLLSVARVALVRYAELHGLAWIEDESNADLRFRRNALRHRVMPVLAEHFPGATASLGRAAALQAEAAGLLDVLAEIDGAHAIAGGRLDCAMLGALDDARARNLLRYFIGRAGYVMPSARRLGEALRQLREARHDARVRVVLDGVEMRRFRGGTYLVPARPAEVQRPVVWRGEPEIELAALGTRVRFRPVVGAGLGRALLDAARVELRLRQGGERIRLVPGGPRRSLKNLLQESAIPPWERDRLPLLICGDRLVWAAGIGCDADFMAEAGEPGVEVACV